MRPPPNQPMRRPPYPVRQVGQAGFTLIELTVVLALGAIMIASVTVAITQVRRADMKASSGMLGGAMRYLYNLAVINNTPYRLVIDIDESRFWGEEMSTDSPCARFLPDAEDAEAEFGTEEERASAEKERRAEAEDAEPELRRVGHKSRVNRDLAPGSGFSKPKDNLLKERKLPTGIKFTGVLTSAHEGIKETGRVAIHFFPGGFAERAYVYFGEQDNADQDAVSEVTVELESLMGRVTRHFEVLDERDFAKESK